MDWLGQQFKSLSQGVGLEDEVGGSGPAGHQYDSAGRKQAANLAGRVHAVHPRHNDVDNQGLRIESRSRIDGRFSAECYLNVVAAQAQQLCQAFRQSPIIINNQDPRFYGSLLPSKPRAVLLDLRAAQAAADRG